MLTINKSGKLITLSHEGKVVGQGPCLPLPLPFDAYVVTAHIKCTSCSGPHGCVWENKNDGSAYGFVLPHTEQCPNAAGHSQPDANTPPASKPYNGWLHARLREPQSACDYLLAHITPQDGAVNKELLALALQDIAEAYGCRAP